VTRRLVIAGTGEHARVVADAALAAGWQPIGVIGPEAVDVVHAGDAPGDAPLPWLGTDADLAARLAEADPADRPMVVLGFGGPPAARRRVVESLGASADWATIVHPAAWVSPTATLGPGTVVLARAVVNTGAVIDAHAIVNSGAIVEHDVRVGEHAHVAPGAVIGGGAVIGQDAFVGLGAAVRDHVTVGDGTTVGMGAAVVADVESGVTVMGVPARA
jgi:acetyltransferase EpsM